MTTNYPAQTIDAANLGARKRVAALETAAPQTIPTVSMPYAAPRPNPQRLFLFVASLFGIVFAELALCAVIPEGAIPPGLGFFGSSLAALLGFGAAAVLARAMSISLSVPIALVALVAAAKVAFGVWLWDTYYYDTDTQMPRMGFMSSDIYRERQSDIQCILEIIGHWRYGGVRYIGEEEAFVSINNRPPAHLSALVIRAYGMRYHSYFPFVAFLTGIGAIAVMASLLASGASQKAIRLASWMVVLWPFALNVGSVMKDVALCGFVMMCAALLYLGRHTPRGLLSGILASFACIAPFRPAYALACLAAGLSGVLRGRARRFGLPVALVVLVGTAAVAERILNVRQVVGQHAQMIDDEGEERQVSKVTKLPIIGKVIYAFGTPFPWTQVFDDELKRSMVFFFAQQTVTLALAIVLLRDVLAKKTLPQLDDAAVLAGGMMALGIASHVTAALYVQVGVVAALPYVAASPSWPRVNGYLLAALTCFIAGNALWMLVR